MKNAPLLNLVLGVMLAILLAWILYLGRTILLPIFTAVIAVYVLVAATERLRRMPVLRHLPTFLLRFVIVSLFTATLLAIAVIFSATVRQIAAVAPVYEANFDRLLQRLAENLNLDAHDLLVQIRAVTIERIDLESLILSVLGGFTTLGGALFLTVIYTAFLLSERASFAQKLAVGFADPKKAARVLKIVSRINEQIRSYIAVKTLINVILGVVSYAILWALDIDFALFWAVVIGLLNYIPYVGSYMGVAFPVILSLAQFGDIGHALILLVLLTSVQTYIGNSLEPRWIGRELNLSPFVVLVSLSVWVSLWGIPGAILAVPLTSILAIILAGFEETRPIAILLAESTEEEAETT